ASSIEAELWKAKRQREAEGATPEHIDPETERFVGFLALLHIVTPDQAKAFSENKPVIDAICMELMAWFGTPCMSIGIFMLFGRMASSQREMDRRLIEVTQAVAEERAKNVVAAAEQGGIPKAPANDDAEMDPHSPEAVLEIEGEELPAFAKNPETVAEAAAGALLRADPHKMYGRKARKRKAPHKSSVILWAKERTFPCPGRHLWS